MKCKHCQTEMLIDSTEETENQEIFNYLCPNPKCPNYGYSDKKVNNE